MAETVTHAFISAKSDSADTTLVSSSEWNDGHVFSGGANGQVLIYDNTQPNNIRWTEGIKKGTNTASIVSSTPTPVLNLAALTFNLAYDCVGLGIFFIAITTVGNATATVSYRIDDANDYQPSIVSPETGKSFTTDLTLSAGTHTMDIDIAVAGGANILTLLLSHRVILFGV